MQLPWMRLQIYFKQKRYNEIDIIQSLSDPSYSGKNKFEFSPKVSQINPMTFFQHTSRML